MRTAWQRSETLFSLLIVAILAGALWVSLGWNQRAGLFPWIVLVPTLAFAAWQLLDDLRGKTDPPTAAVGDQGEAEELDAELTSPEMVRRGAAVALWIIGFCLVMWLLGAIVGGVLTTMAYLIRQREHWRTVVIYGVITLLAMDLVFRQLIGIPFEPGIVFDVVGIEPRLPSIR